MENDDRIVGQDREDEKYEKKFIEGFGDIIIMGSALLLTLGLGSLVFSFVGLFIWSQTTCTVLFNAGGGALIIGIFGLMLWMITNSPAPE